MRLCENSAKHRDRRRIDQGASGKDLSHNHDRVTSGDCNAAPRTALLERRIIDANGEDQRSFEPSWSIQEGSGERGDLG
jgi:hypothetical protein